MTVRQIDPVSERLGSLSATLEAHIKSVDRDRQQAEADRKSSADYRKEVRETLSSLSDGMKQIAPLKKRVDRMEPIVENHRKTLAGATLVLTGAFTLAIYTVKTFGSDIKALIWRVLRIFLK